MQNSNLSFLLLNFYKLEVKHTETSCCHTRKKRFSIKFKQKTIKFFTLKMSQYDTIMLV